MFGDNEQSYGEYAYRENTCRILIMANYEWELLVMPLLLICNHFKNYPQAVDNSNYD
jgi:hypothetical protein